MSIYKTQTIVLNGCELTIREEIGIDRLNVGAVLHVLNPQSQLETYHVREFARFITRVMNMVCHVGADECPPFNIVVTGQLMDESALRNVYEVVMYDPRWKDLLKLFDGVDEQLTTRADNDPKAVNE